LRIDYTCTHVPDLLHGTPGILWRTGNDTIRASGLRPCAGEGHGTALPFVWLPGPARFANGKPGGGNWRRALGIPHPSARPRFIRIHVIGQCWDGMEDGYRRAIGGGLFDRRSRDKKASASLGVRVIRVRVTCERVTQPYVSVDFVVTEAACTRRETEGAQVPRDHPRASRQRRSMPVRSVRVFGEEPED